MQTFDASSIIHGWDNYPVDQFPPFWKWIASQIQSQIFSIPKVAFDEVHGKAPDCAEWLRTNGIERINMSNAILEEAMCIKKLLGIEDDRYGTGVGENDIFIIATARVESFELVSNESRQDTLPKDKLKMKIPAVCDMPEVTVPCINFIELIKQSKEIFQ